ncbi:hypothetical protein HPB51_020604 [Rhipicephalus microplus]|uniref:Uncharacterized protein n=1 Tax=Rhipicephalus microplus TaxID=6941 RepID=A0A9J6DIV4_RHIMP|nr:hypothetical protein HPB51_020604 [Rhipicephalus microplus]
MRKLRVALHIPETVLTAQRVPIPGEETLCITLRWLPYPNELKYLEGFFRRHSSTISSLTTEVLRHVHEKFFHLMDDVNNRSWLTTDTLENFFKITSNQSDMEVAFGGFGVPASNIFLGHLR